MNYRDITGVIIVLFALIQLTIFPQPGIIGTWELVYIAPIYMEDTDPRGITNIRLHFTKEGKLYDILPEEILTDSTESVNYQLQQNQLLIFPGNNDSILVEIEFPDSNTLVFTSELSATRIYNRLADPEAVNKPIEPKSLQLVQTKESPDKIVESIVSDNTDYSSINLTDRICGNWEIVAYKNVPRGEMPPYGFLNDIWRINKNEVNIFQRSNGDTTVLKYKFTTNGEMLVTTSDGSTFPSKCSFDQWGHLLINSGDGIAVLKLISKEPIDVKSIPLKVVLLKLAGEK
jgi:hypothetical protein